MRVARLVAVLGVAAMLGVALVPVANAAPQADRDERGWQERGDRRGGDHGDARGWGRDRETATVAGT